MPGLGATVLLHAAALVVRDRTQKPQSVLGFLSEPRTKWLLILDACLEEANGDAAFIAKALGDIARAKGMTQVARDAGVSRESLYKALSGERSPGFDTILKVIGALGLKLHAEADHG